MNQLRELGSTKRNGRSYLWVVAGFFSVLFLVFLYFVTTKETQKNQQVPLAARTPATATYSKIEPIEIKSSGRLPKKVQGFALGMSLAEAMQVEPSLENLFDGRKPSPNQLDAVLSAKTRRGFSVQLTFGKGQLIYLLSSFAYISPPDAEEFNSDTLMQLGSPKIELNRGDRLRWEWIDGDVRIAYVDRAGFDGSRIVELEVVFYPEWIKVVEASGDQLLIQRTKREWGEKSEPIITKPLPNGLRGLQLRMTPWQVRSAFPGVEIRSLPGEQARGEKKLDDGISVDLFFWRDMLSQIRESRNDVPREGFRKLRDDLIAKYGTPAEDFSVLGTESITWQDERVQIDYLLHSEEGDNWINASIIDKELEQARLASLPSRPPKFKEPPEVKSFF